MDTWKIAGNDGVERSDNSQLAAVFLGKITKCKKLNFNNEPLINIIPATLILFKQSFIRMRQKQRSRVVIHVFHLAA